MHPRSKPVASAVRNAFIFAATASAFVLVSPQASHGASCSPGSRDTLVWDNFDAGPNGLVPPPLVDLGIGGRAGGAGWWTDYWSSTGGLVSLEDFDEIDGPAPAMGVDHYSLLALPGTVLARRFFDFNDPQIVLNGGVLRMTFDASWDFDVGGIDPGEFAALGLGGQRAGVCNPGQSQSFFLGWHGDQTRTLFDPATGTTRTIHPLAWSLTGGGTDARVFCSTNAQCLAAEIVSGTVYSFQVQIDTINGVVDVAMGPQGAPLAAVGGFRLFIQGISALPCANQPFSYQTFEGMLIDTALLDVDLMAGTSDALRVDSLLFEHFNAAGVRSCGDVDADGDIDFADVLAIFNMLGAGMAPPFLHADVNRSGMVDQNDVNLLFLYFSGFDVPLLCPAVPGSVC